MQELGRMHFVQHTICATKKEGIGGRQLANIVYGVTQVFTRLSHLDKKLFAELAMAANLRMNEFNAQDIANTAWAFATLGKMDEKLCAALALAAELRMSEFTAHGIASTAWAFAKLGQLDDMLFATVCFELKGWW